MGVKDNRLFTRFMLFKRRHPHVLMAILVLAVIPVTVSLILGYEMKADVAITIPTVIVDHDNSDFSRDYVDSIRGSQYFDIVETAEEDSRVEQMIYEGRAYAGVIIPENFSKDMKEGKAPQILTIYDGSTLAVIVSSKTAMTEILLTVRSGYLMNIFQGKQEVVPADVMNRVMPIDMTSRTLFNPTRSFRNFLLPGMLAAVVQLAIVMMGAERGWENRGRKLGMERHLEAIAGWAMLGVLSMLLCMSIQFGIFGMPYRGTILGGVLLTILFALCITSLGYIIGQFIEERTFATQLSCILVLPTAILGGYTWPVLAMPEALQHLAKLIPFTYYGEAIRSLCLKPVEIRHLSDAFLFMTAFLAAELTLLFFLQRKTDKKMAGGKAGGYSEAAL